MAHFGISYLLGRFFIAINKFPSNKIGKIKWVKYNQKLTIT